MNWDVALAVSPWLALILLAAFIHIAKGGNP